MPAVKKALGKKNISYIANERRQRTLRASPWSKMALIYINRKRRVSTLAVIIKTGTRFTSFHMYVWAAMPHFRAPSTLTYAKGCKGAEPNQSSSDKVAAHRKADA